MGVSGVGCRAGHVLSVSSYQLHETFTGWLEILFEGALMSDLIRYVTVLLVWTRNTNMMMMMMVMQASIFSVIVRGEP